MGEAVFWLKSLYQLGFVCFFDFYFWIRGIELIQLCLDLVVIGCLIRCWY
ncbi:hypothetical protein AZO1586R_588 [Bathymodiolus azoricus thioautotrophic gill symbiont]|uniref:Uncharacterized protein n=1 Tax=Bathymodiolus azoricus thioautotrophic gill symbiont TaxID=235205 RepID=A0ACA8ZP94_9GAMM|nr:hypothetical protein AZO1586R_588 [Bathymodiolus azoricus thioautotrophic gill symbiont]CAC9527034.1 hypothetical protein [uncultured Gammaproteobacteria bacterium]